MAEKLLDPQNVGVAKGKAGGYAWVAPLGTALPTNAKDALDSAFKSLGYISTKGVDFKSKTSTKEIKDWSGSLVHSSVTSYEETCTAEFLESRESVLELYYGAQNVQTTSDDNGTSTTIKHNSTFSAPVCLVFESSITATKLRRDVIPVAVVSERGDETLDSTDALTYKPTIKCLGNEQGDVHYTYFYDMAEKKDA